MSTRVQENSSTPKKTIDRTSYLVLGNGDEFPLIPISSQVLFPHNILPISDLEGLNSKALKEAKKGKLRLGVITKMSDDTTAGEEAKFSMVGTEAVVTKLLKLPDGQNGALVKGLRRFVLQEAVSKKFGFIAKVTFAGDRPYRKTNQLLASVKILKAKMELLFKFDCGLPESTGAILKTSDDPELLVNLLIPYLSLSTEEKLEVLQNFNLPARLKVILQLLGREISLAKISGKIHSDVQGDMLETFRQNYLREQLKAIRQELGEDSEEEETEKLEEEISCLSFPSAVNDIVKSEMEKIKLQTPGSPEYMVSYNYINLIKELPWTEEQAKTIELPCLKTARRQLNDDHFGLEKVKERILEYLAVMQHKKKAKGEILLLCGPPGVGKTSLAKSIALALNRPFVRVSLGGVKDEAEIRGHRRTYIGALPGKIIQGIRTAKSRYPVILLDEIDKFGQEGRGDASSALLEVLDYEQNHSFVDHYLGLPFDISNVIFIATANDTEPIPDLLLDRMELLELSSYTEQEKLQIALAHLLPKIRQELLLKSKQLEIGTDVLRIIINKYTREAGVRQLKRELTNLGRKVVKTILENKGKKATAKKPLKISSENVAQWLGNPKFLEEPNDTFLPPGVVIGLAYTSAGGDILYIESSRVQNVDGTKTGENLKLTGSLGKVMQESAHAALTFLRANAEKIGVNLREIDSSSVHLHLPDGGTPKDGPSAGLAIMCALVSLFSQKPLPVNLAMTGEITLRGQVLPVGGIKEKILAAHRYHKTKILLPALNELDLEEIPKSVLSELEIMKVNTMEEALRFLGIIN